MPRAAILGTGWIAQLHARALQEAGVELAAVVGTTLEKAKVFAATWQIPAFAAEPSILLENSIDCVHICTPPAQHAPAIRELLSHGKHIFCEKPLALDPQEAQQLAAHAEKKRLLCAVGFNLRFYPALQRAKELVSSKEFGRVLLIHGSYLQEFGAEPAVCSWRYEDPLHAVSEIGSHWLDLAQYVSGKKITALSALFDHFQPRRYRKDGLLYLSPVEGSVPCDILSEDAAILSLRFENGAIGAVVLSELSHGRENELTLEITGTNQSLRWNSLQPEELFLSRKGKAAQLMKFDCSFFQTFTREIQTYYQAIQEGSCQADPCADFRQGSHNVLLCRLAKESATQNAQWMEVQQ